MSNSTTSPTGGNNPQQERDENAVMLLRHLYHECFVPEEKIPPDRVGLIMPVYFFGWLDKYMDIRDGVEVTQKLKLPIETWQFVREVVEGGTAVERFYQVWYNIVLANRPMPKVPLERINMVMLLTFADGVIAPVQVFASTEMLEGKGFTDGIAACIAAKNTQSFVQAIAEEGLDSLHDKGKNYRGSPEHQDPYEVCMGLLISPVKHGALPDPRTAKGVEDYARLFQGIVKPVLPPEVQAHLLARKKAWQEQEQGKAKGGWDV